MTGDRRQLQCAVCVSIDQRTGFSTWVGRESEKSRESVAGWGARRMRAEVSKNPLGDQLSILFPTIREVSNSPCGDRPASSPGYHPSGQAPESSPNRISGIVSIPPVRSTASIWRDSPLGPAGPLRRLRLRLCLRLCRLRRPVGSSCRTWFARRIDRSDRRVGSVDSNGWGQGRASGSCRGGGGVMHIRWDTIPVITDYPAGLVLSIVRSNSCKQNG
jgi:hypothetical protein